jgi:SWI/SNF-related matrix-associated actin-dependent regulator of chromatin subfamily A3
LDFSSEEREYYEVYKARVIKLLDDAISSKYEKSGQYIKALQQLNELRKICSHSVYPLDQRETIFDDTQHPTAWSKDVANEAFEALVCADDASCSVCGNSLFGVSPSEYSKPKLTSCLILICGSCIRDGKIHRDVLECSHNPPCPSQEVSLAPGAAAYQFPFRSIEASTKMKTLITDLRDSDGKKR